MFSNSRLSQVLSFTGLLWALSGAVQSADNQDVDDHTAAQEPPQQGYSEILCASYKRRMDMALAWREQGFPVAVVEDALFSFEVEDDIRTLRFLRRTLREIYAEPDTAREYLDEGLFEVDCIRIHRGY